jgi:hypothetical protein
MIYDINTDRTSIKITVSVTTSGVSFVIIQSVTFIKVFICVGCCAKLLCDYCETFQDSIVVSSSRVRMCNEGRKRIHFKILRFAHRAHL